tara:strand:+ start:2007 stop:2180 length:174 start_codon:yes stop_codon:yes gene_type:complete
MKNNKFKVGDLVNNKHDGIGIITGVYHLNWNYLWVSFLNGMETTVHQKFLEFYNASK